jgi:TldD protein
MKDLAQKIINLIPHNTIQYADVRVVNTLEEEITIKNDIPEVVKAGEQFGFGVRVLMNGAWGFAASSDVRRSSLNRTVAKAISIAKASAQLLQEKVPKQSLRDKFEKLPPHQDKYSTPCQREPFSVPIEDKTALLLEATRLMRKGKKIKIAKGFLDSFRAKKVFASTEGSLIEQTITYCGGGIVAYAIDKGDVQYRSYPSSFRGNCSTAGWEFVDSLDLIQHAPQVAEEAARLLTAPVCPEMKTTLILKDDQLALQVHESIGHPIELDRIFGYEASYAGTSFLSPEMLGQFKYGSDIVNVTADATVPGGLGTFGYDDEGVPAQRAPIIRDGIIVGFLTSRSTAPLIGHSSNATMRADGWSNLPLIRMTNINLEPGEWDYDNLIADTEDGMLLETNKSWSIDDKRINFQFSTEIAREIKRGKIGRIFKNPIYTGITPQFWNSCDAICSKKHWVMWGTPNCGKGEPSQRMYVGHGVAPARFRNVTLRGTK